MYENKNERHDMVTSDRTIFIAFRQVASIAAAGARGETLTVQKVDWSSLMPLAAEQGVVPLVALTVLHAPELECPEALREYLMNALRTECSTNLLRRQRVLHLIGELKQAGIEAKILKGYAIAENYACPESRSSVDTDLLIDVQQEEAALRFLEARGFRITPRAATSHHSVCQHRKYGEIELHVSLYTEFVQEVWFQGMGTAELIREVPITIQTPDGSYTALGYTDHLIFIALHMVKHFILGGLTLRMMLDIALLFARNRERIDAARFWSTMERLHYAKLVNCVLWAMILYGGFQAADFPGCTAEAPEQIALMLGDLLQGGYMGVKETDARYASGMEYNRLVLLKSKSAAEYRLYMLRYKVRSAAKHMFPTGKMLREMYPHAGRHAAVLPFLFFYQMFAYPIKKVRSGALRRDIRSGSGTLERETQARLDMFRELDML